jgi:parallel beta-helix repeat protein
LLLAAAPVAATDFHVAVGGSDANPGTEAEPWATIQHAVDTVGPGDRILVHAGTYDGARIESSGLQGAPITLAAAPGEAVLVDEPGSECVHDSTVELETFDPPFLVSWWIVEGFEIVGGSRSGLDLRFTEDVVVRGNAVHGSGLTGIFTAFSDRPLIEGNESSGNGEHGIYHSNSGDDPVIRGNWLHDNAAAGIHMNADASQGGDGVITGALVEKNVIHGNGAAGGAGINLDGVSESVFVNNLIFDEDASGFAVFQQDGAVCSSDNLFAHNTVLTTAAGRWAFVMPDPGCTGNRVIDNVFWTDHSFRGSIAIWAASPPGFEAHHNAVMDRFSFDGGDTVVDLSAWQAEGHGDGSFLATPAELFADAAGGDYHLAGDGPAVDAGATLADVTEDLDGARRPQGTASDPGAYEAGGLLFTDGFESGDTAAWSSTVP